MTNEITYLISLRDNIDNQIVTGSILYPYYPPTAPALVAPYIDPDYITTQDVEKFVGWSVSRSSLTNVYTTRNGIVIRIRRDNSTLGYFLQLEYPAGVDNKLLNLKGPFTYRDPDTVLDASTLTRDYIAEVLTNFEGRQEGNPTYKPYTIQDITEASGSLQPESNGFRVKTPGYQDLIVFADNQDGSPIVPTEEGAINLGIYNLIRIQASTAAEVASLETVDSDALIANAPKSEKITGVDKVSQLIEGRAIDLKKILITAIAAKITEFGISNIKELLEGKTNVDEALSKLPKLCPTQEKLKQLIAIRNRYAQQLNTFYNNITRLSKTLTGTTAIVEAVSIALQIASTTRKTANIALGFLPATPGAAPAAINTLKDLEESIRPKLDTISKGLGILTSTVAFVAGIVATIVQLLQILDKLIQLCAEESGVPFSEINNELTVLNNTVTSNLQNTTPNINNSYRGFRFEILLDSENNTKYPKRYAVGRDKFNVILLKGESSFTPNTQVLIDELKFIIDRDNLSAE